MAPKTRKKTRKRNKGITLIKKANTLIEARYKFDVWETRFFLTVLSHIRREDEDFKAYRIWYKDVIKTFGLKSNQSYDLLREAGKSLMRKTFKVSNVENGFKRETEYHIIRTVNYLAEGQQKQGVEEQEYLDVTVEPEMKPLLLQLQRNFTAYDLRNVIKLGTYPVRVYELLKQYESIGQRKLRIDELKRMFELNDEYPLFANFHQRVIKPSIKDINAHTDITITDVERIKQGRKVVALNFIFESKQTDEVKRIRGEIGQQSLDFPDGVEAEPLEVVPSNGSEKDRLFTAYQEVVIQKFGVTPTVFLKLLESRQEGDIKQAIRVTRRAKMNGQIKSNIAGFFVNALVNGYTDPKEEATKQQEKEKKSKRRKQQLKKQIEVLKEEQAVQLNEQIRVLTNDDPDITKRAIRALRRNPFVKSMITDKEKTLKRKLTIEDFRQDKGLRDMVKGKIVELVPEHFAEMLQQYEEQLAALEGQLEKS